MSRPPIPRPLAISPSIPRELPHLQRPTGNAFSPITPTRLVDTRSGNPSNLTGPALQDIGSPVYPRQPHTVYLSGLLPVTASALALNVTLPSVLSGPGYLTVYPANIIPPMASNLNWMPGDIVANAVTVGLSSSQEIDFYSP
jgi:hypothetical protein